MAQFKYHLKRPDLRANTDLREYANDILKAIEYVMTGEHIKVEVFEDEYILTTNEVTNGQARLIGERLAGMSRLGEHVKRYVYNEGENSSTQLFIRKEEE